MQTQYIIQEYVDKGTNNICEIFWVLVDGKKVFERDYGSQTEGIIQYIEDYGKFYCQNN